MPGHASRAKHTLLLSRIGVCPFSLVRSLLPSSAGVFPKVPLPFSRRLALLLTGLLPSVVMAAPPAITGITPAGVQAGKSVTVSLKGAAGDPAPQVSVQPPRNHARSDRKVEKTGRSRPPRTARPGSPGFASPTTKERATCGRSSSARSPRSRRPSRTTRTPRPRSSRRCRSS